MFKFKLPSLGIRFKESKYYNPFLGCPKGYRKQEGYTRKTNGKRIPTRCVHVSGSQERKAVAATRRTKKHGGGLFNTLKSLTAKRCPRGYVYRKAYTRRFHTKTRVKGYSVTRKDGTRYKIYPKQKTAVVKASCIREKSEEARRRTRRRRAASPATPATPSADTSAECRKLKRGEMSRYNYQYRLPASARRLAVKKAVADMGPLRTYKKLKLASKCAAGVKPVAAKVFAGDAKYIADTYAIGSFV
jgi:hypothetical protein